MKKLLITCCIIICHAACFAQIITTIAGTGVSGYGGDGGPATAAQFGDLQGIRVDGIGNVYFGDGANNRVRKIDLTGIITTFAGTGTPAFSGDGGPATAAALFGNSGIELHSNDGALVMYIADGGNARIREVKAGVIRTIAGNGSIHSTGDGGPATAAGIAISTGVTVDASSNVYISEYYTGYIRKVDTSGIITRFAGNGITGHTGDGGPATAAEINTAELMVSDAAGNIFFACQSDNDIRKIDASDIITTVAGNSTRAYSSDGGPATATPIDLPQDLAVDNCGNIFIPEFVGERVRVVNTLGIISTIAGTGVEAFGGDGGPATAAQLDRPISVALDAHGNVYILDVANFRIRKITYGSHPPAFTAGGTQHLSVCKNAPAVNIDTLLAVIDSDAGQQEAWKVLLPATHGLLSALYATTSTGSVLLPSGLTYAPVTGYTGTDTFQVQVSDCGTGIDHTTVYVSVVNCALSIAQPATDGLQIYPNPTDGSFTISFPTTIASPATISVTNSLGAKVKELNTTTGKPLTMDLKAPPGIYFVKARTADGTYTAKLVME